MGEMTAVEYFKEKNRMTKKCGIGCENCPFGYDKNATGLACVDMQDEYPETAISIVKKWAEEHPRKTMLQDFLEKYPKAPLETSGIPMVCPYHLGYGDIKECISLKCKDCWNRPLEEE